MKKPSKKNRKSKDALLIIDMLNTLDFPGGDKLLKQALPAARAMAKLKERARKSGVPVIYVNDNFGKWKSDWHAVLQTCLEDESAGRDLARLVEPNEEDFFVLKPKHSGFYSTTLDVLLDDLGSERLIITGIAGNICVLFTVNDAHMREYEIIVPKDCIASNTKADNDYAIRQMSDVFGIKTCSSAQVRFR